MFNGWKIAAKTQSRTSLRNDASDETVEILHHSDLEDAYDVHSIMYSSSSKSGEFYVLYCDGIFSIDYSGLGVSPPPGPDELRRHERPVQDNGRRELFFEKVSEALWPLPKKKTVESVLEHAAGVRYRPYSTGIPPAIEFLDLGCGNGKRVLSQSAESQGTTVGVDYRPPIYNDSVNSLFFRAGALEFLGTLSQRKTGVGTINADFLLGKLGTSAQTATISSITAALSDGGCFSFCEDAATAKKIVETLRMIPSITVRAAGFKQAREWIGITAEGRRVLSKFADAHPEYADAGAGTDGAKERTVPASMPVLVRAYKNSKETGERETVEPEETREPHLPMVVN